MSESRPHLVAVPESEAKPAGAPAAKRRRSPGGQRVTWLLGAVLALCVLGFVLARREAAELSRELAATQGALGRAEARLEAIEAQRRAVRAELQSLAGEATALAGRLGELEALVAQDPAPAADAQPMRNEAAGAAPPAP